MGIPMVRKFVIYLSAAVGTGLGLVVIGGIVLANIDGLSGVTAISELGMDLVGATVFSFLALLIFGIGDVIALVTGKRPSSAFKSNATSKDGGNQTANEASREAKRNRDSHA